MKTRFFLPLILGMNGCFTSESFEECDKDEHCGSNDDQSFICVQHSCVPLEEDELLLEGELTNSLSKNYGNQTVILRDLHLKPQVSLSIKANKIKILGTISADGAGSPGGHGGGGGGGGHGGKGGFSDQASSGQDSDGLAPGEGGFGQNGAGANQAPGGAGGKDGSINGQQGEDGQFVPIACDESFSKIQFGSGGGGGGGGRGGFGATCQTGGGGGGGGAGGPGGGAIVLYATQEIYIDGQIFARGLKGSASAAATDEASEVDGHSICTAENNCDFSICDEDYANGGRGAKGYTEAAGNPGADDAGQGGPGGAGGGGMVRLITPKLSFTENSWIDVSDGNGTSSQGGQIWIQQPDFTVLPQNNSIELRGAQRICR